MKTPKEYTDNLRKGVITKRMLADCLFSVNKRAKNCRDKEREYRRYRNDYYGNENKYREQKENYYNLKEKMLSLLLPTCIHVETVEVRRRIYDYYPDYFDYDEKDHIYEGCYYDKEIHDYVEFFDIIVPESRYYLFYDLGIHSFHTPIDEEELKNYSQLKTENIGKLITYGNEIGELISIQFVNKLIKIITTGTYVIIPEM